MENVAVWDYSGHIIYTQKDEPIPVVVYPQDDVTKLGRRYMVRPARGKFYARFETDQSHAMLEFGQKCVVSNYSVFPRIRVPDGGILLPIFEREALRILRDQCLIPKKGLSEVKFLTSIWRKVVKGLGGDPDQQLFTTADPRALC